MPRLPSSQDVQQVSPRTTSDPGVRVPAQAFDSPLGAAAQELSQGLSVMAKAQHNIDQRRAAIDKFRLKRQVKGQAQSVSEGLLARGEVLSDKELNELGAQLQQFEEQAVQNHVGGELSKEALREELKVITSSVSGFVGTENTKRSKSLIDNELNGELNTLTVQVGLGQIDINDAVQEANALIDSTEAVFDQKTRDDRKRGVVSQFTESIIDRRIAQGDLEGAVDMIENPRIQNLLEEKAIQRILRTINTFKQSDIKGIPRDVFERLSPEEQKRAVGALKRGPLVNISPGASELEKLDAKRVDTLATRADQARRNLQEQQRMRLAIESGNFPTGPFERFRLFGARLADFANADDDIRKIVGDAATADQIATASRRLASESVQRLGRVTNMSLQFVKEAMPGLMKSEDGNLILLEVMDRAEEREIQISVMAEEFISLHETLRPKGEKSFFQRVRNLEEEDPVIDDQLRQRILEGGRRGKGINLKSDNKSKEVDPEISTELPEDVTIPEGFEFVSIKGDKIRMREIASGKEATGPVGNLRKPKKSKSINGT